MYRRSQTNREIKLLRESVDPNHGPSTFDDEENVIVTVLIALHDHILANTASTGPTMDAKNRVWDIIRERLCNRVGAIQRTDEQVSQFFCLHLGMVFFVKKRNENLEHSCPTQPLVKLF